MFKHVRRGREDRRGQLKRKRLVNMGVVTRSQLKLRQKGKGTARWHLRYANAAVFAAGLEFKVSRAECSAQRAERVAAWRQLPLPDQDAFKLAWDLDHPNQAEEVRVRILVDQQMLSCFVDFRFQLNICAGKLLEQCLECFGSRIPPAIAKKLSSKLFEKAAN
jgi:hypothetical protein